MAEDNIKTKSKKGKLIAVAIAAVVLGLGAFTGQQFVNDYAEGKLAAFTATTGYDVTWSDVKVNIIKRTAEITNVRVGTSDGIALAERIVLSDYKKGSPLPQNLVADVQGFSLPVTRPIFGRYYAPLWHVGYREIAGSVVLGLALSPEKQLDILVSNLTMDYVGVADARISLANVDETSIANIFRSIDRKTLSQGWLTFVDGGLTSRSVAAFAKDANIPIDDAESRILNGLNRRMQTQYRTESAERTALTQLYRYFDNPSKLTITIKENQARLLSEFTPPQTEGWRRMAVWFISRPFDIVAN
ncbi:MAG: hypothetical protein LBV09_04850 [Deferribacteraceae bacterium]|jgi:hypothetical protein|nr:hypothetical protein [Deferribacteraceae bacterium]